MPRIGSMIMTLTKGKTSMRMRLLRTAIPTIAVILVALTGHSGWAQTTRTLKVIVPLGPGSSVDIVARLLAEQMERTQGRTTVIENRLGAGGIVATEAAAGAAPDGNTVLFTTTAFVVNALLRKVNYDPLTSFEPICHLVNLPNVIAVNSASPYRTLTDLLNGARTKPGELTLASVGPGTASQITFEVLKRTANVNMTFVPYQGTPPAINALLGDHVTSVFVGYADVIEQLDSGKLRALAVASLSRVEPLPDLPTVAESGYKDFEAEIFYGVVAPSKTPKETVAQLARLFTAALQAPDVKRKLVAQGIFPVGICGTGFADLLRKKYDEYGRVIRESNMKVE
jgi:tripartite-type tricarboxylate transporter receptor subunit TctC